MDTLANGADPDEMISLGSIFFPLIVAPFKA